ncbi:hypothetical protein K461DRAFT_325058 [Myriangium duriaei CBS 260.36]|uniref:Rhodopsin domain-containing protein n=1 Tax=Myriangium duriaei CBS 260.36 TaxID=1168546 RepID=A0A9P4MCS2_9PEZI|nr:hypothetical protein K461DRAFT_325058 [Myriangium duriaei CBS 260.36]
MGIIERFELLGRLEKPFQIITSISLVLRLVTRIFVTRRTGLEDYAIALAWLSSLGVYISYILVLGQIRAFMNGAGHLDLARLEAAGAPDPNSISALLLTGAVAWFLAIFRTQKLQQRVIYITISVTVLYSIINAVTSAATCGATTGLLGGSDKCSTYIFFRTVTVSWSALNAVGDLIMAVLALDALWWTKMKRNTKIVASLILILGTFGGVASFVRLYIISQSAVAGGQTTGIDVSIWTAVEIFAGITAANLAFLRPLLSEIKSKLHWLYASLFVLPFTSKTSNPADTPSSIIHSSPGRAPDADVNVLRDTMNDGINPDYAEAYIMERQHHQEQKQIPPDGRPHHTI